MFNSVVCHADITLNLFDLETPFHAISHQRRAIIHIQSISIMHQSHGHIFQAKLSSTCHACNEVDSLGAAPSMVPSSFAPPASA